MIQVWVRVTEMIHVDAVEEKQVEQFSLFSVYFIFTVWCVKLDSTHYICHKQANSELLLIVVLGHKCAAYLLVRGPPLSA